MGCILEYQLKEQARKTSCILQGKGGNMASVLIKLREDCKKFSEAERAVAARILEEPEIVEQMGVHELASECFVSSSTIVRMCHHSGFIGYKDFRKEVIKEIAIQEQNRKNLGHPIEKSGTREEVIDNVTYRNMVALEDTKDLIDIETLKRCLQLIDNARFILLFGMGASFCAASDLYLKFLRLNKPCFIAEDWHSQLLQARNSTKEDLAIVFSYSGNTVEMVECLKALEQKGTPSIAITRCLVSPVSELATEKLYTSANESIVRSGAMGSRIAQLNIIDILYSALTNESYEKTMDQIYKTHIKKPHSLKEETEEFEEMNK